MGGKSGPNYGDLAVQQGEANAGVVRDQTYANRPNQQTPWGYTQWDSSQGIDPATGESVTKWNQTTGLSPQLQSQMNKELALMSGKSDIAAGLMERMQGEFGNQMDWRGLSPMGGVPTSQFTIPENTQRHLDYGGISGLSDPTALRGRAEDAIYGKAQSRLAPQYQEQRRAAEAKMRNQGLGPEDAAWKAQMSQIGTTETDAYGQAQFDAITGGRAEAGQLFGQEMGKRQMYTGERDRQADFYNRSGNQSFNQALSANQQNYGQAMQSSAYANQIRQQQITEALTKRGSSLNEINALMSGGQVQMPNMPNFSNAGSATPAPVYQAGVDQGNAGQMGLQGLMSGATSLGSAYMMR